MITCIEILEEKRKLLIELLKTEAKNDLILAQKLEFDKAIHWLKKINELKWDNAAMYDIVELPDMNTGFSEYRIMNDCETDDRSYWLELEPRCYAGDYLIIAKPR